MAVVEGGRSSNITFFFYYTDEVACTNPDYCYQVCQSHTGCSNIAYPRLVLGLMPDGKSPISLAEFKVAL